MARDLSRDQIQRLARIGAERRLQELRDEVSAILAAFPDLARGGTSATGPRVRRRPRMNAAQRRAVSERMKKYWAARRKAKG